MQASLYAIELFYNVQVNELSSVKPYCICCLGGVEWLFGGAILGDSSIAIAIYLNLALTFTPAAWESHPAWFSLWKMLHASLGDNSTAVAFPPCCSRGQWVGCESDWSCTFIQIGDSQSGQFFV